MSQPTFIKRTISDYTLLRQLGQGGQGDVFYAENSAGESAAVKLIHPEYARNTALRERFRREADVMISLNHPAICKAYSFHEETDHVAIVMEYLEGENLEHLINRFGPVQPTKVAEWFRQLLPAFQYAHEQGVIHRDVKPSNVLITGQNRLKILDFSIAKALNVDEQGHQLTHTKTMLGTPLYMSPEQIQTPKHIDQRTDIYSLGVMLYTLVAGRAPFDAPDDSLFSLHHQIVNNPVPKVVGIPNRVNQIIAKATAKNRDYRYQSCADLLHDIEQVYPPSQPQVSAETIIDHAESESPSSETKIRLVTPALTMAMTFLALPVAMYFVSRTYRGMNRSILASRWLIGSIVWGILFLSTRFISASLVWLLHLGLIGFTIYTVNQQRPFLNRYKSKGGTFLSGWLVLGLTIGYILLLILLLK